MKKILIAAVVCLVIAVAVYLFPGGEETGSAFLDSFTLNGYKIELSENDSRYVNDTVYLSSAIIDTHLGLHTDVIVEGRQIGMCTEDQCYPYDLDKDDPSSAFQEGELYFVPIADLMRNIEGSVDWDPETKALSITY
ncbi:hypothetical protein ACFL7D_09930 [candidate division KSB1 bacterium]